MPLEPQEVWSYAGGGVWLPRCLNGRCQNPRSQKSFCAVSFELTEIIKWRQKASLQQVAGETAFDDCCEKLTIAALKQREEIGACCACRGLGGDSSSMALHRVRVEVVAATQLPAVDRKTSDPFVLVSRKSTERSQT